MLKKEAKIILSELWEKLKAKKMTSDNKAPFVKIGNHTIIIQAITNYHRSGPAWSPLYSARHNGKIVCSGNKETVTNFIAQNL